jgi:hypothetical protein
MTTPVPETWARLWGLVCSAEAPGNPASLRGSGRADELDAALSKQPAPSFLSSSDRVRTDHFAARSRRDEGGGARVSSGSRSARVEGRSEERERERKRRAGPGRVRVRREQRGVRRARRTPNEVGQTGAGTSVSSYLARTCVRRAPGQARRTNRDVFLEDSCREEAAAGTRAALRRDPRGRRLGNAHLDLIWEYKPLKVPTHAAFPPAWLLTRVGLHEG